jgi:hypothetical protein
MPTPAIKFKVRREHRSSGQIIEVLALARSSRILGIVELTIPLMPGYSLADRIGSNGEAAIVKSAEELAKRIAEAVEKPNHPTKSSR